MIWRHRSSTHEHEALATKKSAKEVDKRFVRFRSLFSRLPRAQPWYRGCREPSSDTYSGLFLLSVVGEVSLERVGGQRTQISGILDWVLDSVDAFTHHPFHRTVLRIPVCRAVLKGSTFRVGTIFSGIIAGLFSGSRAPAFPTRASALVRRQSAALQSHDDHSTNGLAVRTTVDLRCAMVGVAWSLLWWYSSISSKVQERAWFFRSGSSVHM